MCRPKSWRGKSAVIRIYYPLTLNGYSNFIKAVKRQRNLGLGDRDRQSVLSVMFWGCITYKGVGELVSVQRNMNSEKYINVLDQCLWPVVAKHFPTHPWTLQEDNAPCHVSARTTQWKRDNQIPALSWPAQSPDLNIIENVWRTLKIYLQRQLHTIKTKDDLIASVKNIWYNLPLHYIQSLYDSIPWRIRAVMRGNNKILNTEVCNSFY